MTRLAIELTRLAFVALMVWTACVWFTVIGEAVRVAHGA
jgi:hypothetical protein